MMNFLTDGLGGNAPLHIIAILFISLFECYFIFFFGKSVE